MLKKANLDERVKKNQPEELEDIQSRPLDRNELLKILNPKPE